MNASYPPGDHSPLICLLALFLFSSPLNRWWSTLPLPWYAMYLPWLLIIILVAINQLRLNRKQDRGD